MSFKITATKTWTEREEFKKLFAQTFSIDDMIGFKVGIKFAAVLHSTRQEDLRFLFKVSLLGVDSLWGDCTFIPADWGS